MKHTGAYKIYINEPCGEAWDEMKPETCGRYCNACEKIVVDLVDLPDKQILEIIQKNPTGFCARMNEDLSGRALVPARNKYFSFAYFSRVAAGLFTTASILLNQKSVGQTHEISQIITQQHKVPTYASKKSSLGEQKNKVFGNVVDTTTGGRIGVAGIRVRIDDRFDLVAITDRWGYYEIEVPPSYNRKIFYVGADYTKAYFGEPVAVRFGELPLKCNFYKETPKCNTITMGGVSIIPVKKTAWWKKILGIAK